MTLRYVLPFLILSLAACGGSNRHGKGVARMAVAPGTAQGAAAPDSPEALVIEGSLTARVDDVLHVTAAIAERVRAGGGRVVQETGTGAAKDRESFMRVRLSPGAVDPLIEWLDESGDIVAKQMEAKDVSKTLFDQELALENLHKTLARMQALLERADLDIEAVLKIEAEMSRVRGEIEVIKGEQRYLKDRVSFATLDIHLERRNETNTGPQTKFMTGMRLAGLHLLDPGSRTRTRAGVGLVLQSPKDRISYELDVFDDVDGDGRAVIATMGGAAYSDHLGAGKRSLLNPYLGLRMGYGSLNGSNFVLAGEAGLELFKNQNVIFDVNMRATTFFGKGGPDVALVSAAEFVVAF